MDSNDPCIHGPGLESCGHPDCVGTRDYNAGLFDGYQQIADDWQEPEKQMTVRELIRELLDFDPHALVVIAKDAEGNDYSPHGGSSEHLYMAESTWSGSIIDEECYEEVPEDAVKAVVLWPTN